MLIPNEVLDTFKLVSTNFEAINEEVYKWKVQGPSLFKEMARTTQG